MSLFLSTYLNKIDKKGRISVPAPFRAVIAASSKANQDFLGIIAYSSFVNNCIEACSMGRLEKLSESIDNLDPYSDSRDAFATTILGGSVPLAFDSEGRITLPENLIKDAGINDSAIFVGKGQAFEIWRPESFEIYSAKARDIAKKERSGLHLAAKNGAGQ